MKPKKYDYYLIVLTMLILLAIGIVCIYGITFYNYLAVTPEWTGTIGYLRFIDDMNSYLYPFLVLLLISLGLCIPKRLFEQKILVKISVIALGVTFVLTFLFDMKTAMFFLLSFITGIQVIVLILTFNKNRAIRFEKEGYLVRMGSSMLHLGIVILIFNFVTLIDSEFHILIFWIGTLFVTAGNIFSFYPERMNSLFQRKTI